MESLRAWKLLLLALNEAFDRKAIDTLLALDILKGLMVSGDGLLSCASLLASKLLDIEEKTERVETDGSGFFGPAIEIENRVKHYWITLSPKGRLFVNAWKQGDQSAAIGVGDLAAGPKIRTRPFRQGIKQSWRPRPIYPGSV
jgi:hypothetical protein